MPAPPDPEEYPEAWDGLRIGPKLALAPGIVSSLQVTRSQKLDVKTGKGRHGATMAANGYDPAKVSIELTLWTARHRLLAAQLLEVLVPKLQKKKPEAFQFAHPVLAMHGITKLVVESIEGPSLPTSDGIQRMQLNCVEHFPPPPTATGGAGTGKIESVNVGTFVPTKDEYAGPPPRPSATKPGP